MEFVALVVVIRVIIAAICGAIASSKGRNVVGWVVLGFLFEIIPLIIVACLPNLRTQREKEVYIASENRRLREQLRQEQIKGETFRQHAAARLDAHDERLQINTRSLGPQLAATSEHTNQLSAGASPADDSQDPEASWYYSSNGATFGPVPESKISELIRNKSIIENTLIWSESLTEWQPAGQVQQFTLDFLGAA